MKRALSLVLFLAPLLTPPAAAQMLGNAIDAEWIYPSFPTVLEPHTVTVSGAVELPSSSISNSSNFDLDLGDDWIEFRFSSASNWTDSSFNGWRFRDATGSLPPIQDYRIDAFSTGVGNVGGISVGFNDEECWADFGGMTVNAPGDWIRLKVTFTAGALFCFGDLSDGLCPCGNLGSEGEGCQNTTGVGALLGSFGSGNVALDDLVLHGTQLPPDVSALFFAGDSVLSPGVPFGDGLLCAGGPLLRLEVVQADANGRTISSVSLAATLQPSIGDRSVFQLWYRDPVGPCNTGFNSSSALAIVWN